MGLWAFLLRTLAFFQNKNEVTEVFGMQEKLDLIHLLTKTI